jgi:hypothetical protein
MLKIKNLVWTSTAVIIFIAVIAVIINVLAGKLLLSSLIAITFLALILYFIHGNKQPELLKYFRWNKLTLPNPSKIKKLTYFINPIRIEKKDFKVLIGNSQCKQPFYTSVFNIETKSNDLKKPLADTATHQPGTYHLGESNIEEEIDAYTLNGKDLVWQIGPEYLGCKTECGNFNAEQFKKNASRPEVKMIELKLSPVSNSNYCNISLPGAADIKNVKPKKTAGSPLGYTAFKTAEGMILFLDTLRRLSAGKPVGLKLCIGDKKQFHEICYAILKTQVIPDFIAINSTASNGAAATSEFTDNIDLPLYEALQFVSKTLQVYKLEKEIKIIVDAKIFSGFDVLKMIALGAGAVCTYMPYNDINSYVVTYRQSPFSYHQNVAAFHNIIIAGMHDIMEGWGFENIHDITPGNFFRRLDMLHLKGLVETYFTNINKVPVNKIKHSLLNKNGKRKEYVLSEQHA